MLAVLHSLGMFIIDLFKSRRRLEAENLFLRHQLSIALRRVPPRLRLRDGDRALLAWMIRLWPNLIRCGPGGSTGDHPSMAPGRLQEVLALEIPEQGREANDRSWPA